MTRRIRLCCVVLGMLFAQAGALCPAGAVAQTAAGSQPAVGAPLALTPNAAAPARTEAEAAPPTVVFSPPISVSAPPPAPASDDRGAVQIRSAPLPLPQRPIQNTTQTPPLRLEDLATSTAPEARVYFHYSTAQDGGEETARQYAHHVLDNGFLSIEIRPVTVPIKSPSIRYFYDDDRAESVRLGQALQQMNARRGLPEVSFSVVDFLRFTPKPRKGTIEVWIPNEVRLGPGRTDVSARPEANPPRATVR